MLFYLWICACFNLVSRRCNALAYWSKQYLTLLLLFVQHSPSYIQTNHSSEDRDGENYRYFSIKFVKEIEYDDSSSSQEDLDHECREKVRRDWSLKDGSDVKVISIFFTPFISHTAGIHSIVLTLTVRVTMTINK